MPDYFTTVFFKKKIGSRKFTPTSLAQNFKPKNSKMKTTSETSRLTTIQDCDDALENLFKWVDELDYRIITNTRRIEKSDAQFVMINHELRMASALIHGIEEPADLKVKIDKSQQSDHDSSLSENQVYSEYALLVNEIMFRKNHFENKVQKFTPMFFFEMEFDLKLLKLELNHCKHLIKVIKKRKIEFNQKSEAA